MWGSGSFMLYQHLKNVQFVHTHPMFQSSVTAVTILETTLVSVSPGGLESTVIKVIFTTKSFKIVSWKFSFYIVFRDACKYIKQLHFMDIA